MAYGEKFEIGTRIHVKITGVIGARIGAVTGGPEATTSVTQVDGGGWMHYLFLGSGSVTGDKNENGIVKAEFDARVTGEDRSGPSLTTKVTESGFIHYLFLDSEAVTVRPEPASKPATTRSAKDRGTIMSIGRYDNTINSGDVASRIEDLEGEQGYEVIRVRNNEVLFTASDEDGATAYIEDEDYNPARVIVRQQELDAEDGEELDNLRALDEEASRRIGDEWTLYNEDFFDEAWAKEEARNTLGISYSFDLDTFPLNLIDWDNAAIDRRDDLYPIVIGFDGREFYAEND
jgi:hypothetical protein